MRPAQNQAQKFPARDNAAHDHLNGLVVDIKANREFFRTIPGFMLTEQIVLDDGTKRHG